AAVGLEAATDRQFFAEPIYRPCQDFLRLLVIELDGGFARLEFVHDETQFGLFGVGECCTHVAKSFVAPVQAAASALVAFPLAIEIKSASLVRTQKCVNVSSGSRR